MILNTNKFDLLVIRDYYPSLKNPASSTWVFDQVEGLIGYGYTPLVISPTPFNPFKFFFPKRFRLYDSPSNKIEFYKGTDVIRPSYIKVPNNKLKAFTLNQLSRSFSYLSDYKNVKLIHAHFGQNGVAALALKKRLSVPLITSFYGYDSGRLGLLFQPFYKDLIREGDLFLALSEDMKSDLIKLGFPKNKILIHHLGVDIDVFTPSAVDHDIFTLITVARLDEVKGIQYVVEALKLFLNKYPHLENKFTYKIIGGGVFEPELRKKVHETGLDNNVQFINNLILKNAREIVQNEIRASDIFLLCSITPNNGAKEGTPIVLMEAQASGKPCIATFHAGIPEVVINNKTGFLVKEKDSHEIMLSIEKFFFNQETLKRMGIEASIHIAKEFNHSLQMKKLSEIYYNLTYQSNSKHAS